ncbi:MAG: glycosyltransferase WbuB, partial [Actinomycetales bacterium]
MRIAYLHQYFRTPDMSGGTRSYEMARRFVAAGHEVHMITTDESPSEERGWRQWEVEGITVHSLPVTYDNSMSFARRVRAFVHFALVAGRRAGSVRPDLVLATSTPLTIAVPAAVVKWRRRVPVVFEVRDLWPEMPIAVGALRNPVLRWLAVRLERFAYGISERVVALSPGMVAGVERAGVSSAEITLVPNSSDVDVFDVPESQGQSFRAELSWLGDAPLVVYCGTLGHVNSVEWLAELAARVRERSAVQFLVVGRGVGLDTVRETAARLGVLDTTFHVLPPVPKRDVPAILSAATVSCSLFAPIPEMEAN